MENLCKMTKPTSKAFYGVCFFVVVFFFPWVNFLPN